MHRLCVDSAKDLLDGREWGVKWLKRTRVASCEFDCSRDQKQAQSDEDSSDNSRDARTPRREGFGAHGSRNESHRTQIDNPLASNTPVRLAQQ